MHQRNPKPTMFSTTETNKNIHAKIIQSSKQRFSPQKVHTAITTPVLISAAIDWNGLPKEVVKSPPLEIFKIQTDKS